MYLNTHTYYSFKYGTFDTKTLLQEVKAAGASSFVLTDINSTAASLNFVRLSAKYEVKPILGIDFRNGADQLFVAIAHNNQGSLELNNYLSYYLHSQEEIPERAPEFRYAFVVYPFTKYNGFKLRKLEFIGVKPSDIPRLIYPPHRMDESKLVMLPTVTFRSQQTETGKWQIRKRDFNTHRLLRAIDNNTLLSKLPKQEEGNPDDFLRPVDELKRIYAAYPYMIENTQKLLDQCSIHFDFKGENLNKNLKTYTGSNTGDYTMLEQLCEKGLLYRYKNPNERILKRIQTELEVIKQQGFMSYFFDQLGHLQVCPQQRLFLCR